MLYLARDFVQEKMVGFNFFSVIVGFFAENFLPIMLDETQEGYIVEYDGFDLEMREAKHFSDIVGHDPLKGYFREVDFDNIDVVVDAGAYPGEFSIAAAKKGAKVIALEPDPQNVEELKDNLALNGVENDVEVVEKGLWNRRTEKSFQRDKGIGMASRLDKDAEAKIQLDTLDNIVSDREKPDLVKMDIEGAEIEALDGCVQTIDEHNPIFEIATYHFRDGRRTYQDIERKLDNRGYDASTGYKNHLTTYGFPS